MSRAIALVPVALLSAALAAMTAVDAGPAAAVAVAAAVLGLLALPAVRAALIRPQALPFLLAAPTALSVYPALAVPVTTGVLTVTLLTRRFRLKPREVVATVLAATGFLLPLAMGLIQGGAWTYLLGDALQFAGFFLAVLVARTTDVGLLSRVSLWGLWCAVVAVTIANALGRVDFLAAPGSDIQRNINFLAPVLLVWALTDLLWNGMTRRALLWTSCAGLFILLGFTRGMWAGAAAGVIGVLTVYVLGGTRGLHRARRLAAAVLLCVGAATALSVAAPAVADIAVEKVATMVNRGTDFTYQQRNLETEVALAQLQYPLIGEGWGATYIMPATPYSRAGGTVEPGTTHYVHNQYAAQLLRTGWFGCALTLLSLLLFLRIRPGAPGSAAALGTLAYVLVTGWTSPSLFTYPTNFLAGLAVGAAPMIDAYWRAARRCEGFRRPARRHNLSVRAEAGRHLTPPAELPAISRRPIPQLSPSSTLLLRDPPRTVLHAEMRPRRADTCPIAYHPGPGA